MQASTHNQRKYGLVGNPLSHSFSKKYFTGKFLKENIRDTIYELYETAEIGTLADIVNSQEELKGLNITIPFKETVIPFLDELDETAKAVGAVNTIKIIRTDKTLLVGYNTDVYGFQQSIKPFLESAHERALILGTGGASKAVEYVYIV